jgi:hypothetical protein
VASAAATGEYPDGRPPANGIGCWTPCSMSKQMSHPSLHSTWHQLLFYLTGTTGHQATIRATAWHHDPSKLMQSPTWNMTGVCGGLLRIGWQATGHGVQSGFSSAAAACRDMCPQAEL